MASPSPGIVIDRYQVVGPIGAGSMGDVVKATDIDLKRTVAIKILSDRHRDDSELEARFVREGRAVAAISHANVVQVFTTGTYDGRPYIAMEFLTGIDLGGVVQQRGPMSSLHAARAVLDTARGLEAAADAGLIHRDVKPANLVMLDSGSVKVTDFGLAKPLDTSSEPALTALGVVVGTPDYIAPEQARGEKIDERVDIYALGGTLYYLLVGTPPFRRGNPVDDKYLKVVARHLQEPAPNAQIVNPELDGQLTRLQLRMMSKKAANRPKYPELIAEIDEIVERLGGRRSRSAPELMKVRSSASAPAPTPFLGAKSGPSMRPVSEEDPRDSLPTTQRPSVSVEHSTAAVVGDDSSLGFPTQKRSGALMVTTAISALIFLTGLVLFRFGPMPEAKSSPAVPQAIDAGTVIATTTLDAAPTARPLVAPEGMVIVPATDDEPAIFISAQPVNYGDFSKMFPNSKEQTRNNKKRAKPITSVSFADAARYARTMGGRLATPGEWKRALATSSLSLVDANWEWLDDSIQGTQAPRRIGSSKGELGTRRPREHNDVGFRVVRDP